MEKVREDLRGKWIIWSKEHQAWWCHNGRGYAKSVKAAGLYTLTQARAICKEANFRVKDGEVPEETMLVAADYLK